MSLEERVMAQLKQAMKDKNEIALRTLRSIKAAILEAKTAANAKAVLTEADEIKLLQKMAKQRKDSLTIFQEKNREDLAAKESEELKILATFLPVQLGEAELKEKLKDIIHQMNATSAADLGSVIGRASKELAGKADGSLIAKLVKELLS